MIDFSKTARRAAKSPTFWLGLTIALLLWAVWQNARDRPLVVRNAQVEFCQSVTKPAAKAAAERDRDIAIFATAAAQARRKEGEIKTALVYEGVVMRSKERESAAEQRASIPCVVRFPKP